MYKQWTVPFDLKNDTYVGKPTNWDFITTRTSENSITLSWLPIWVTAITPMDIIWIISYDINWKLKWAYYPKDFDINVNTNIITINNWNFLVSDSFAVYTNIPRILKIATDTEVLASTQDITASYADIWEDIDVRGYTTVVANVIADCNDSEDVVLKILALNEVWWTDEYELETDWTKTLWSWVGTDFKKSYPIDVTWLSAIKLQVIAWTLWVTPAYLTGWSSAQATFWTWEAITDWSFAITIDWFDYEFEDIDFTWVTSMADVATLLQTLIRTATWSLETVVWSTDHFIITSVLYWPDSEVSVTSTFDRTDISWAWATTFLDAEVAVWVVTAVDEWVLWAFLTGWTAATSDPTTWAAVLDWAFGISIDWTAYDIKDIDFSTVTTMEEVATILQTAIQTATGSTETVVWDTDHFIITSANTTASSAITVTSTYTETDISWAWSSDWLDSDTGNGTETAVDWVAADLTINITKA